MSASPSIAVKSDERARGRRLFVSIGLMMIGWIIVPYLVRIPFGSEAANGEAGISMGVRLVAALEMTKPRCCHLSKPALSRVYAFVATCFFVGLTSMILYLWFYG